MFVMVHCNSNSYDFHCRSSCTWYNNSQADILKGPVELEKIIIDWRYIEDGEEFGGYIDHRW